jgi:hypothetical protein
MPKKPTPQPPHPPNGGPHPPKFPDPKPQPNVAPARLPEPEPPKPPKKPGGPLPPYGTAIHQAIAGGDLNVMRALVTRAEAYLDQIGDLRTAVEILKVEIAKLEKG